MAAFLCSVRLGPAAPSCIVIAARARRLSAAAQYWSNVNINGGDLQILGTEKRGFFVW